MKTKNETAIEDNDSEKFALDSEGLETLKKAREAFYERSDEQIDGLLIDAEIAKMALVSEPLRAAITGVMEDTYIGNVIAAYDEFENMDTEQVCKDAASYVLEGMIGALCYNVLQGHLDQGARMLNKALDDVDRAAQRDDGSEQTSDRLSSCLAWAAQMDVQQSYRKSLQAWVVQLHVAVTSKRYAGKGSVRGAGRPTSPGQTIAAKLKARRNKA